MFRLLVATRREATASTALAGTAARGVLIGGMPQACLVEVTP